MNTNRKAIYAAPLQFLSLLFLMLVVMALSGCPDDELDLPVPDQTPVISQQPADTSVTAGNTATFNIVASNGVTYQWQTLTNGNWTNIPGATTTSYAVTNATQGLSGTRYRVLVSAGATTVVSSQATLTVTVVVVAPAITVQPANQTVTEPAMATFNVTATGSAPLTYQWVRFNGAGFLDIPGATSATYVTPATARANDDTAEFRVVVTNSAGSVMSNTATLTVNPAPVAPAFTTQPANITVTEPATASFTVAVTGTPAPTLQWQVSSDSGATWNDVSAGSGATATTYVTEATSLAIRGRRYRAVATNSAGSANSDAAILSVDPAPFAPVIQLHPLDTTVYEPATATFIVGGSASPSPTIQWQRSDDGGSTWSNIVGANAGGYTTPATSAAADNGARFRAVAQNIAGTGTSNAAVLTVLATVAPVITTHPVLQEVTGGAPVTFTVAASGSPAPTFEWQVSLDSGMTWFNSGAPSSSTFTFVPLRGQDGAEIRAVATNSAGSATSNPARFNNLANMTVLTSINGALGGTSTPPFHRFNGAGLDNAGNFVFVYGDENGSNTDVIRTIAPTTGVVSLRATIATGVAANGVAFDPAGNMYIANTDRVQRVDTNGVQSNYSGGYNHLFAGIVYLAGTLYATNDAYCVVHGISVPGSIPSTPAGLAGNCGEADGTGTAARFRAPTGLALQPASNNMYLCDYFGSRLVSLSINGTATTLTSSGVGSAFGDPSRLIGCDWLTSDDLGNVYYLAGATVYKRRTNGITAIVGRLSTSLETRVLQWAPPGYLAVGNASVLLRLDLR